jgi:hypothetical protein
MQLTVVAQQRPLLENELQQQNVDCGEGASEVNSS